MEFLKGRGIEVERMKGEYRERERIEKKIIRKNREMQREERWSKIIEAKYNKYGVIKGDGGPEYLKKRRRKNRWMRVAQFRLGGEMKGNKYWEKIEKRSCRVCGWGEKPEEHMGGMWRVGGRRRMGEWVGKVLGDKGEGE